MKNIIKGIILYKNKKIGVVLPLYNEETQIAKVVNTMPTFVDKIIIVDDKSTDETINVVMKLQSSNEKIILIKHETNLGCGGSIISGYKFLRDNYFDIGVRMDGDGQMDPEDLSSIIDPIIDDNVDYVKGNRFMTGEAYTKIPKVRYFGNAILSLLTKIVSGYWHIADSQSGYTACNDKVLKIIKWDAMYKRYGQPNDLLVKLNVENFSVRDVPVNSIYGVGEKSGLLIKKAIFTISWLLFKNFFWRLKEKYIIRDFHPLVFFYFLGFIFGILFLILSIRLSIILFGTGYIPPINALAAMFSFMSSSLFILFAMWFDMETNKELKR